MAYCPVEMKKSKPEGLARIQAGGKRSATPAIRYITENGRQNPSALFCHPFGVLNTLTLLRRGFTPACVLPPLRGFEYSHSSTQGFYPCLWSTTPSGFWMLSFLNAGVLPLPVVYHPFGVLNTLTLLRRGLTPACGLPPLRGFEYSHSSTQGSYPCLWSATPSGF